MAASDQYLLSSCSWPLLKPSTTSKMLWLSRVRTKLISCFQFEKLSFPSKLWHGERNIRYALPYSALLMRLVVAVLQLVFRMHDCQIAWSKFFFKVSTFEWWKSLSIMRIWRSDKLFEVFAVISTTLSSHVKSAYGVRIMSSMWVFKASSRSVHEIYKGRKTVDLRWRTPRMEENLSP